MHYFYNLFEKSEDRESARLQEKSLENLDFSKSVLLQTIESLKTLIISHKIAMPRLFFLSNSCILKLYSSQIPIFLANLKLPFPGISEFLYSNNKILGFLTKSQENVIFDNEIVILKSPVFLINIEKSIQEISKSSIRKALLNLRNIGLDFAGFWKAIIQKTSNSQAISMVLELIFYEELEKILIKSGIEAFAQELREKASNFIRKSAKKSHFCYSGFINRVLSLLETLDFLKASNKGISSFEYLALPKFTVSNQNEEAEFSISLVSLNYSQEYSFEVLNISDFWVFLPQTPKLYYNYLMTIHLQKAQFLLNENQGFCYKKLAFLLAKPYYELIMDGKNTNSFEFQNLLLEKTSEKGIWLKMRILGFCSEFLLKTFIKIQDFYEKSPGFAWAIQISYENLKKNDLPRDFLDEIRSTSISEINKEKILEIGLFELCGQLEEARVFARKIMVFYYFLSNSLANQAFFIQNQSQIEVFKEFVAFSIENQGFSWGIIKRIYKEMCYFADNINKDMDLIGVFRLSCQKVLKNSINMMLYDIIEVFINEIFKPQDGRLSPLVEFKGDWEFIDYLTEILKKKNREISDETIEKIKVFFEIISGKTTNERRILQLVGNVSIGKTSLIKIVSEIYSQWKSKEIELFFK